MTKKDYELIAEAIFYLANPQIKQSDLKELVDILCKEFKRDNDRFDEVKFREACGYNWL